MVLYEEVYMRCFKASDKKFVRKLHKALCGLKQAPRVWYERLTQTLILLGFTSNRCDPLLFVYSHDVCHFICPCLCRSYPNYQFF